METMSITAVKTANNTSLEDCKKMASFCSEKVKAKIQKEMQKKGVESLPLSDMQWGVSILGMANPYDEMKNMIAQFNNCMLDAWKFYIELVSLQQNTMDVENTDYEVIWTLNEEE